MSTFHSRLAAVAAAVTLAVTPQAATASETTADSSPVIIDAFSSLSSSSPTWNIPQDPAPSPSTKPAPSTKPKPNRGDDGAKTPGEGTSNSPAVTINQGDRIFTDLRNSCTIGYIDKEQGVAYTAFHCGKRGMDHRRAVYVLRDGVKVHVGTMIYAHNYLPEVGLLPPSVLENLDTTDRDITAIKFDSNVTLGGNTYSGDVRIPIDQVHKGENACFYGVTTGKSVCGTVRSVQGGSRPEHHILVSLPNDAIALPGDSGGVAYIPGRGSIGIVKGAWIVESQGIGGFAATGY